MKHVKVTYLFEEIIEIENLSDIDEILTISEEAISDRMMHDYDDRKIEIVDVKE